MKRLLVLVMVIGLFTVGTARADGAWVLWEKGWAEGYQESWSVISAFPSYKLCMEKLEVEAYWSQYRVYGKEHKKLNVIYECLPESVDPRK